MRCETTMEISANTPGAVAPAIERLRARPSARGRAFTGSGHGGFTLLELLVVLAILAMIAAFAAPEVVRYLGGARSDSARVEIESLVNAIDLYRLDVGRCPPDLEALLEKPSESSGWNGPYLRKQEIPRDPWGNEYIYRCPGEHGPYDLLSLGADDAEGGDGEDADIVSWRSGKRDDDR